MMSRGAGIMLILPVSADAVVRDFTAAVWVGVEVASGAFTRIERVSVTLLFVFVAVEIG